MESTHSLSKMRGESTPKLYRLQVLAVVTTVLPAMLNLIHPSQVMPHQLLPRRWLVQQYELPLGPLRQAISCTVQRKSRWCNYRVKCKHSSNVSELMMARSMVL